MTSDGNSISSWAETKKKMKGLEVKWSKLSFWQIGSWTFGENENNTKKKTKKKNEYGWANNNEDEQLRWTKSAE